MFLKETLLSFTTQYIVAHTGNSCVPVFASSAVLPETLKKPIVLFLHSSLVLLGWSSFHDVYNGLALMPVTDTSHGGSLLVKYINSLWTHVALLAPMCQPRNSSR
jgi:hypothetical protein